jgi:hypothetical protein
VQWSGSRPRWRSCAWLAAAGCLLAAGAWGCRSSLLEPLLREPPHDLGSVEGEVYIAGGREPLADLGPVIVYLERARESAPRRSKPLVLADDGAGRDSLGHDLVVISHGEALRFASHSGVAHRLFAVRQDSRLEVAVPELGESSPVTFDDPGSIRFYCSLHQDETWDVFVSPSPHFARLDRRGAYRIDNVPPGDYELSIWSAAVDGGVRTVHVGLGISALEPIWLDPAKIAR